MSRTNAQRRAARERAQASRGLIVSRYRAGESMQALASAFGVSSGWLAKRFDTWKEPRRNRKAARMLRCSKRPDPPNA
ncbi:hypothetical protein [Streptomyces sp. NPDC056132]|uniref:hypothetical protein n=1 Tax=Streptomyces sp. NPDC056132 TaxID=3345722 RepID=UPI0035DA42B0